MENGSANNVDEMAQLIFDYLQANSEAGDSLEGIIKWWILGQRINESTLVVQKALDKLKAEGLIIERQSANQPTIYYVEQVN
jgi:hypothetical protein